MSDPKKLHCEACGAPLPANRDEDRVVCSCCGLTNVIKEEPPLTGTDNLKEALNDLTNEQGCAAQNIRALLLDEQAEEEGGYPPQE